MNIEYLSPMDIRQLSVVQVTEAEAFGHLQASPLPGGLYDLRMGPVNRGDVCKTCGLTSECPGHVGHIELVSQVYNPFLVRRMLLLLKKMCTKCGHFRLKSAVTERLAESFRLLSSGKESEECQITLQLVDELARANIERDGLTQGTCHESFSWLNASTEETWEETSSRSKADIDKSSKKLKMLFAEAQRRRNFELSQSAGDSNNMVLTTGELQAFASRCDSLIAAIPPLKCENCSTPCGLFRLDGYSKLFFKQRGAKASDEKFVTPAAARAHLARLFNTEKEILSFLVPGAHEQQEGVFFLENVVVPPNRFRPLRALGGAGGGVSSSMYLPTSSLALKMLLEANEVLRKELGVQESGKAGAALVALQDAVNSYMDATKNPRAANPDSIKVGVRQILERKQGLFRMKMMGKRVNYAARSVISPDVSLETNHIGIPMFVAKELTVPEPVNAHNADYLQKLVENGPDCYPGAVSVLSPDGRLVSLIGRTREQREAIAATLLVSATDSGTKVVHRHLRNGDPLLVNRQPTLHKPGIMALLVRVLRKEKTIRMHYANCNTFNADFDGDEINLHCPQDPVARAEALGIANADKQFLGPTAGHPLRGLIQDHVIGGTMLTGRDTFLNKAQTQQLLYTAMGAALKETGGLGGGLSGPGEGGQKIVGKLNLSAKSLNLPTPAILKPIPLWTGKQVITGFLNALIGPVGGLSIEGKARTQGDLWGGKLDGNKEEEIVIIKQNELLQGVLDKNAFGNANAGLTHTVYELLGAKVAGLLLTGFSRLFTLFLQNHQGFTCAMADLLVKPEEDAIRHKMMREATQGGWAKLRLWVGEEGEAGIIPAKELSDLSRQMGQVVAAEKGNKGAIVLGKLEGLMLGNSSEYWGKCIDAVLPKGQKTPFPANCFSAMVNTGAKGSKVNQSQICCLLGQQELEGHRVPLLATFRTLPSFAPFDFSARAGGFISDRFLSGIRPQEFFFHCMAGREGLIDTAVKTARSGYLQRCLVKHLECLVVNYDQTVRDADSAIVQFAYGEDGIDVTKSSYLNRIKILDQNRSFLTQIDPKRAFSFDEGGVASAYEALRRKPRSDRRKAELIEVIEASKKLSQSDKASILSAAEKGVKTGLFDPVESLLSPACFIGSVSEAHAARIQTYIKSENPSNPEELEQLLNLKFMRALADPGEAVGTLAAQGMGEPSTQMTLNTFHLAGHGGANVTLGIPRLREIVQTASRRIATPSMHIPCSVNEAKSLQGRMERVALKELVLATHVSEKVVSDQGSKVRVYELVIELADLDELNSVYPEITREAIARFLDKDFRERLDREVKKLIRSSAGNSEVKVQRAINDLTGGVGSTINSRSNTQEGDEEAQEEVERSEPKKKRNAVDDAEPAEIEQDDNDEDESEGQYEDDSSSADSDSSSSEDSGDSETESVQKKVVKKESSDSESEEEKPQNSSKKAKTGAPKMTASASAQAVHSAMSRTSDDVFCFPGQLYDNTFVLRSREMRLNDKFARKILILEVVEELCSALYLQETPGITRVIVGEKGLDTEGVNLDVFWAMSDIDHNKLRTNDIALMLDRYGVESCRLSIVNEISRVFGHYGISVDRRHLSLIADYMTHQGGYRPFNRAGMTAHSSPFLKMTFETSVNFLTAACHDRHADNLQSPAGALILGKLAPIGTGIFSLRNEHPIQMKSVKREISENKHFVFEDDDEIDEDDDQSGMIIDSDDE